MKVALVCGSLSTQSSNAMLLEVARAHVEARGHHAHLVTGLAAVPIFDPGSADSPPARVADVQAQLRTSDVVLLAAPEYAAGVAGSTKNLLDWMVGDATIYRTPVGVASVGTTGGPYALEQLVRTISWQGGWPVATLGVSSPRTKSDESGQLTDDQTLRNIESWVDTVVEAASATAERRRELLAAIIEPLGIDVDRFGDLGAMTES